MVRKIGIVLSGLLLVFVSVSSVVAKNNPPKTDVWHCGCEADYSGLYATVDLRWSELNISSKSKGHQHHYEGQVELCSYYDDYLGLTCYQPWERGHNDCQEVGAEHLTGVEQPCENTEPSQGALCGEPVGPAYCPEL